MLQCGLPKAEAIGGGLGAVIGPAVGEVVYVAETIVTMFARATRVLARFHS